MDAKGHWDRVYATKAPDAVSWYQATPALSLELIRNTGVPTEGSVLDVGGGASALVDHLVRAGYARVGVLDLAADALATSKARLGDAARRVEWYEGDVRSFESPYPWTVWHDRAVLHFLTDAGDRVAYREAMLRALEPGGHAIIATFSLDGPPKCSGLEVVRYSPDSLAAELGDTLTLMESRPEAHATPGGAVQNFVYCRFARS